jgi:hypothetical protein
MQGQIWVEVENLGPEEGESRSSQVNTKRPEKIYQKQKASGKMELGQPYKSVPRLGRGLVLPAARVAFPQLCEDARPSLAS